MPLLHNALAGPITSQTTSSRGQCFCAAASVENNCSEQVVTGVCAVVCCFAETMVGVRATPRVRIATSSFQVMSSVSKRSAARLSD